MMVYSRRCCAQWVALVETDVVEMFTACDYPFPRRSSSFNSHEPETYLGGEITLVRKPK
jgi:hypothetical protein